MKRYNKKCRRVQGASTSAVQDAIDKELPRLKRIFATYVSKDVWNVDVFGLSYRQPSTRTSSLDVVSKFKKEKSCITFLARCTSDGIESTPLMIIGTA